jgi:hypothetical protein
LKLKLDRRVRRQVKPRRRRAILVLKCPVPLLADHQHLIRIARRGGHVQKHLKPEHEAGDHDHRRQHYPRHLQRRRVGRAFAVGGAVGDSALAVLDQKVDQKPHDQYGEKRRNEQKEGPEPIDIRRDGRTLFGHEPSGKGQRE